MGAMRVLYVFKTDVPTRYIAFSGRNERGTLYGCCELGHAASSFMEDEDVKDNGRWALRLVCPESLYAVELEPGQTLLQYARARCENYAFVNGYEIQPEPLFYTEEPIECKTN